MHRSLVSLAVAIMIATASVPAVLAADTSGLGDPSGTPVPSEATGVETPTPVPTATADPHPAPTPTPPGSYDGTIVEDPTFVSGGELPTQPASRAPAPGGPVVTPPPTDTPVVATPSPASSVPFVLLAAAALIALTLAPASRARRVRTVPRRSRNHRIA